MHVIVVGCGRVGSGLAATLEPMGHSVAVIDSNPRQFRRLPEGFSGKVVRGLGQDRDDLEAAGIAEAGALAAVTNGDNRNILCARIAREHYEVEHVVARIYDPRRAVIYARLGIPTVATVAWTTDQVLRHLVPQQLAPEWVDATGSVSLVERPLPDAWAGRRLADLEEPQRFRIVAVARGGRAQLVTPELVAQDGDVVYFAAHKDALDDLWERLSPTGGVS
ncbi:TrkA family potassium uptake protein [soil metagenome]